MARKNDKKVKVSKQKIQQDEGQERLSTSTMTLVVMTAAILAQLLWRYISATPFKGNLVVRSANPLVQEAWDEVVANNMLREIKVSLPDVHVKGFKRAELLNTETFMDCANKSESFLCLVTFFDPRSESFLLSKDEWERAAEMVEEDPFLRSRAKVSLVNAAVDTYLQKIYSPELQSAWQEQGPKENESVGFLFGKSNFYPIIAKGFKGGNPFPEFKDSVRADRILQYIRLHVAENYTELSDLSSAESFLGSNLPSMVGCFPGEFSPPPTDKSEGDLSDSKYECLVEKEAFRNYSAASYGRFQFGYIKDDGDLCASLGMSPCSILVSDEDDRRHIFSERLKSNAPNDVSAYNVTLARFAAVHREPFLSELTPDNSWVYMRRYRYLAILLIDPDNRSLLSTSRSILSSASETDELQAFNSTLKFTYANGEFFAAQFNIPKENLPNLVFYDTWEDDFQVYFGASEGQSENIFATAQSDSSEKKIAEWLRSFMSIEVVVNDTPSENVSSSETQTVQTNEAQEEVQIMEDGEEEEEEEVVVNDSKVAEKTETNGSDGKSPLAWQKLAYSDWMNIQISSSATLNTYWDMFMKYYASVLVYEEAYQNMDETRRDWDENKVIRSLLDKFYDYLSKQAHWLPVTEILPKTPSILQELGGDEKSSDNLWGSLQQLSAYKRNLQKHIQNKPELKNETLALFAKDAALARNVLVELIGARSKSIIERYNREKGRGPMEADRKSIPIERRSANDLSMEEFINDYARKRKPVIIQDLKLFKTPWTKLHISEKCGHYKPRLVRLNLESRTWGGLVEVDERISLKEFLATHTTNETRRGWYLHDWGLPLHCPEIIGPAPFEEFIYPRYFAGDYFQRLPFVGYQHSWPSLFVGANGTESRMHIDSGGTNFWMYLLEGEKEWRFFDRMDTIQLYEEPGTAHYMFDVFRDTPETHPLAVTAPMYHGIQKPGDLIFIPGGCPHGVRNFDDIVGVSMNYLDLSNEWLYLWMQIMDEDYRDFELYAHPSFPRGLKKNQEDLTLGKFKSGTWYANQDGLDLQ